MSRLAAFVALLATVVAANWALSTFGIVPIGFGLMAPAGVFFAGLAFGLRDVLHETGGRRWVLAAIAAGALLSYAIAPSFAIASAVGAFGCVLGLGLFVGLGAVIAAGRENGTRRR